MAPKKQWILDESLVFQKIIFVITTFKNLQKYTKFSIRNLRNTPINIENQLRYNYFFAILIH